MLIRDLKSNNGWRILLNWQYQNPNALSALMRAFGLSNAILTGAFNALMCLLNKVCHRTIEPH